MAQLPPDGEFLIQQNDGIVQVFNQHTQEVLHSFNPLDANATAIAQGVIWHDERLTDEQRCFAVFWSGYFHAHARGAYNGTRD